MPYFPGMGYGIGTAAVKGLAYKKEYDEAQDLKERQMQINEAAEQRVRELADESIANSKLTRAKDGFEAESVSIANKLLYPAKEKKVEPMRISDPSATPAAVAAAEKVAPDADSPVTSPGKLGYSGGNPTTDLGDGQERDEVTGIVSDQLPTIGKKGAVKQSAPKAGEIGTKLKPTGYGLQTPAASGGSPADAKAEGDLRKGKSQMAPSEVTGLSSQAEELHTNAIGVEERLQEALQTIQSRYGGDETMAKYLKANVIAKVRPQIELMRGQAAQMRQQAQLAQFAHEAGMFSEGLLGKLETAKGPAEVDAWLDANADSAKKLGVDLERFRGLHKNTDGAIVNNKGYIFPRTAILASANAALPFTERLKYMQEADKMYKIQEDIQTERMRVAQSDTLRVEKWTIEQKNNFAKAYAKKDYEYDEAKKLAAKGGEFTIMKNGKPEKVQIPGQYKPTGDWLGAMRDSEDPNVREVHKQVVNQLELDRSILDTADRFLGGFRARVQPVNESTIERDNRAAKEKSYGVTSGKLKAAADAEAALENKQNAPLGNAS